MARTGAIFKYTHHDAWSATQFPGPGLADAVAKALSAATNEVWDPIKETPTVHFVKHRQSGRYYVETA